MALYDAFNPLWRKLLLLIFLALVCFEFLILLFHPQVKIGYFILPVSRDDLMVVLAPLTLLILSIMIVLVHTGKKKKKYSMPLEELRKILYEIEKLERSSKKLEGRSYKLAWKILPILSTIVKDYKPFLHSLSEDLSTPFYELYFSLAGKHGHVHPKRLIYMLRHLKEATQEILRKYGEKAI